MGFGSLAFAHAGKKLWFGVPHSEIHLLDKLVERYDVTLFIYHVGLRFNVSCRIDPADVCPGRLYHRRVFLDPQWLMKQDITVYKVRISLTSLVDMSSCDGADGARARGSESSDALLPTLRDQL
jgi:hypothetical protein